MTIVEAAAELPRAMVDAYTYGDVALVEQHITGTEIAIGIIDTGDGPVALPAVEIEPLSGDLQLRGAVQRGRDALLRAGAASG